MKKNPSENNTKTVFNRKLGKAIDSSALKATATDSLNDCVSTAAVLAVAILLSLLLKTKKSEESFVKIDYFK